MGSFTISLKLCKVKEKLKAWFELWIRKNKKGERLIIGIGILWFKSWKGRALNFWNGYSISYKGDLLNLYLLEERNLIQKSMCFFHRFLLAKKWRNLITELVSSYGVVLPYCEIESKLLSYFASLYKRIPGSRAIPSNILWSRVSAAQNSLLIAPFGSEERLQAIKSLGKNKAPDPTLMDLLFSFHPVLVEFQSCFVENVWGIPPERKAE